MRKKLVLIILLFLSACSSKPEKVEITISIAASMVDAIEDVIDMYEKEHPNIDVLLNVGSSGALQQQIVQGAPVDLFFSAAEDKFARVIEEGLIRKNSYTNLLRNELVLVEPIQSSGSMGGFDNLVDSTISKIAIGTPETVPAGDYAVETFKSLGIYQEIKDKLVQAKDVRQVLQYVETENVQAGIVYKTDAIQSEKVTVVASAPPESHTTIIYPLGVLKRSENNQEVKQFYTFLQSDQAIHIYEEFGFKRVGDQP
jgi:molybdate transport system substrate-binding protein